MKIITLNATFNDSEVYILSVMLLWYDGVVWCGVARDHCVYVRVCVCSRLVFGGM